MELPVKFEALARAANTPTSGGYPYSLKGRDLDKNFKALADALTPDPPQEGTYVLGSVDGTLQWIATEEC